MMMRWKSRGRWDSILGIIFGVWNNMWDWKKDTACRRHML